MSFRAYLSLVLVAAAVFLDRIAYYSARSVLFLWMVKDQGMATPSASTAYASLTAVSYVVTVVAGAIAIGVGPRAVAVVGAVFAAAGASLLAASVTPFVSLGVFAIGTGLLRPCMYAIAADAIVSEDRGPDGSLAPSPRRFAAVTAAFFFVYASVNVGSIAAPALGAALYQTRGPGAAFGASFALYVIEIVLAIGLVVVGILTKKASLAASAPVDPYRGGGGAGGMAMGTFGPQEAAASPGGRAIGGVAILAVPTFFYAMGSSLTFSLAHAPRAPWVQAINPIVVTLVSMVLFVLFLVAAVQRWAFAPLVVWGVGFAVFALGLFPIALSVGEGGSPIVYALGSVVVGAGEALVAPVAMAYAALSSRRGATLAIALYTAVSYAGSAAAPQPGGALQAPVLIVIGLLALVTGIAIAILGQRMHRSFFDPAAAPARAHG